MAWRRKSSSPLFFDGCYRKEKKKKKTAIVNSVSHCDEERLVMNRRIREIGAIP